MEDIACAAEQRIVRRVAADVALLDEEVGIGSEVGDVVDAAAHHAIDRAHREPLLEQEVRHVAADEPRAAGDDGDRAGTHAAFSSFRRRTLK
jgi:hypothetical protein